MESIKNSKKEPFFLNEKNVQELVGKKVTWKAPGYEKQYCGTDIVKSVDFKRRFPIVTEVVTGDNLRYAYLENFGLVKTSYGIVVSPTAPSAFTYTDDYREVEIISVEDCE